MPQQVRQHVGGLALSPAAAPVRVHSETLRLGKGQAIDLLNEGNNVAAFVAWIAKPNLLVGIDTQTWMPIIMKWTKCAKIFADSAKGDALAYDFQNIRSLTLWGRFS